MDINNGKATIQKIGSKLNISIPSKKNWFVLIFGTAWLGGWLFGLIAVLRSLGIMNGEFGVGLDWFLVFWSIAWTCGGLFFIGIILWGYFGVEKIGISNAELDFSKTVFGLGIRKTLKLNQVKNFRFNEISESMIGRNNWAVYGVGPGKVKFDYGFKTYSFGLGVDEAEAHYLVTLLNKKIGLVQE